MQGAPVFCSGCATGLAPSDVLYTPDGRIVCAMCSAKRELVEADRNVGGNILKAGIFSISSAATGFVMFLFPSLPFLILGLALEALGAWAGIYALRAVNRKGDERFTKHVQSSKGAIYTTAIIGLVISVFVGASLALAVANHVTKVNDKPNGWQSDDPIDWR